MVGREAPYRRGGRIPGVKGCRGEGPRNPDRLLGVLPCRSPSLPTPPLPLALDGEPAGGFAGWAAGLVDTMGGPGAGLAIALENLFPPLRSEVVLSPYVERAYTAELLATGAERVGHLLKDRVAQVEEFLDALDRVHAGGAVIDPEVVRRLVVRTTRGDPLARLTPRERAVLEALAQATRTRRSGRSRTSRRVRWRSTSTPSSTSWSSTARTATAGGSWRCSAVWSRGPGARGVVSARPSTGRRRRPVAHADGCPVCGRCG